MISIIKGLPKPAQIAVVLGGVAALGYALWYVYGMYGTLGLGGLASGGTAAPTEAAPTTTTTTTRRALVGTDSTGAPVYGSGNQSVDKSAASVAARVATTARRLVP